MACEQLWYQHTTILVTICSSAKPLWYQRRFVHTSAVYGSRCRNCDGTTANSMVYNGQLASAGSCVSSAYQPSMHCVSPTFTHTYFKLTRIRNKCESHNVTATIELDPDRLQRLDDCLHWLLNPYCAVHQKPPGVLEYIVPRYAAQPNHIHVEHCTA
jgi:hypothetical protein